MKITNYKTRVSGNDTPWRLYEPTGQSKEWVVLWLQGFTSTIDGHKDGVVRMATGTKTSFAMLNYAGHGNNPIPLKLSTRSQQFDEVCAVYDELSEQGYKKFIVIGGSFGAYMAALLLNKRKIETIVLRAPAIYADEEFNLPFIETRSGQTKERQDMWRNSIKPETPSKALDAVRAYKGNVYVIEHEFDTVVNRAVPLAYFAVANNASNYIVIRGCDHSPKLMPNPQKFYNIIERWLGTIIRTSVEGQ